MHTERRDDEQSASDHREHVSDDRRPVAPAQVHSDVTGRVVRVTQ